jgi:ketosteroid isomerase-like protein
MEGTLSPLDPEIEFVEDPGLRPDAGTYVRLTAIREYCQAFWDAAAQVAIEADEFIEQGDKVIVPGRQVGRFRVTGIEGETPPFVHVWTVRNHKLTHLHSYTSKAEALEAVGLSER